MFEHLDDSQPFVPDDDFRRGVFRRGHQLRLRRRRAAAATGLAVTVAGLGVAGALYVDRRDAAIDRVVVQEQPSIDGATNILLVGNDREVMGRYVNGPLSRVLGWAYFVLICVLAVAAPVLFGFQAAGAAPLVGAAPASPAAGGLMEVARRSMTVQMTTTEDSLASERSNYRGG